MEEEQKPEDFDPDWWDEPPRATPTAARSTRGYQDASAGGSARFWETPAEEARTVETGRRTGGTGGTSPPTWRKRGGVVRYLDWTHCPQCDFGFSPDQERRRTAARVARGCSCSLVVFDRIFIKRQVNWGQLAILCAFGQVLVNCLREKDLESLVHPAQQCIQEHARTFSEWTIVNKPLVSKNIAL